MENPFILNDNKAMIWQILVEQGAFNNIPNNYLQKVQTTYEGVINNVNTSNYDLTNKNKMVMVEMKKYISELKKDLTTLNPPVRLNKPLEEVKIQLSDDFNAKQNEFIQLVNHNKPGPVEFSDKEDTPIDKTDMNTMLNEMKSMRENVYGQVNPELYVGFDKTLKEDTEKSSKETTINSPNIINESNNSRQNSHNGSCHDYMWSSFGNNNNNNKSPEKNVKFTHNDFVSKLKTIKPEFVENLKETEKNVLSDDLYKKLLDNQNIILGKLDIIFDKLREKE